MVSAPLGIEPEMGLSLPSNWTEKPYAMGFPSAATPSNVYFTPSPCATTVRVRLFGPGPGSNVDFVTSSFQVPTSGLVCAKAGAQTTAAKAKIETNFNSRIVFLLPISCHRICPSECYGSIQEVLAAFAESSGV